MFIVSTASTSRMATARLPLPLLPRSFSTSPISHVKRPQKPYEAPVAKIDAYGRRIPLDTELSNDRAARARAELFDKLAEQRSRSVIERYGNRDEFGLRRRAGAGAGARSNDDGTGGEDEGWKRDIGITRGIRRRDTFKSASQQYKEIAQRLGGGEPGFKKRGKSPRTPLSDWSPRALPLHEQRNERPLESGATRQRDEGASRLAPRRNFSPEPSRFALGPRGNSEGGAGRGNFQQPGKSFGLSSRDRDGSGGYHDEWSTTSAYPQATSSPTPKPSPTPTHSTPASTPITENDLGPAQPSTSPETTDTSAPRRPWQPTKKLTYSAMAGLKTLHTLDPEKFSREVLSRKFGISREAVTRILKSRYRDREPGSASGSEAPEDKLRGTKWDRNPASSESVSPVPAIIRAYASVKARSGGDGGGGGGGGGGGA